MHKILPHFTTITKHKLIVTKLCMRCGLFKQGFLHDLSKYSWIEFSSGVRYFQGNRSPIDLEKETLGYSLGWLHHKGRNKHHWEYWLDNSNQGVIPIKMPVNYIVEMFCDRVGASKIYYKDNYTDQVPIDYFMKGNTYVVMEPSSKALIQHLLQYLAKHGLDRTIHYIKTDLRNKGYSVLNQ